MTTKLDNLIQLRSEFANDSFLEFIDSEIDKLLAEELRASSLARLPKKVQRAKARIAKAESDILHVLKKAKHPMTCAEIASAIGASTQFTQAVLNILKAEGRAK